MNDNFKPRICPASLMLTEQRSDEAYTFFLEALETMTVSEIEKMEEELAFFAETGFVGVVLSRIVSTLPSEAENSAAA